MKKSLSLPLEKPLDNTYIYVSEGEGIEEDILDNIYLEDDLSDYVLIQQELDEDD